MSQTWFISDSHFSHFNIIRYTERPFISIGEMDECLINNYLARVSAGDTVYHLGDFALANIDKVRELLSILPGHKTLIMGNHDRLGASKYLNAGFERVIPFKKDYSAYEDIQLDGMKIRLCHYPGFLGVENYDTYFDHCLGGHSHNRPYNLGPKFHNISVEMTNYYPITLEEALQL